MFSLWTKAVVALQNDTDKPYSFTYSGGCVLSVHTDTCVHIVLMTREYGMLPV